MKNILMIVLYVFLAFIAVVSIFWIATWTHPVLAAIGAIITIPLLILLLPMATKALMDIEKSQIQGKDY